MLEKNEAANLFVILDYASKCRVMAPMRTSMIPTSCTFLIESLKKTYPRKAAIPPDSVLTTVTTDNDPVLAPRANAENPTKLKTLAHSRVLELLMLGATQLLREPSNKKVATTAPVAYRSQSITTGPRAGSA